MTTPAFRLSPLALVADFAAAAEVLAHFAAHRLDRQAQLTFDLRIGGDGLL